MTRFVAWGQQVSHYQPINPPENSLEVVALASALGFDVVEVDVQLTKDQQLVLMHDFTLDRATTASGKVADYTADELASVRIKSLQGQYFVARFADALTEAFQAGRMAVMCDLRDTRAVAIRALVRSLEEARFPPERLFILAYDVDAAVRLKGAVSAATVLLKLTEPLTALPGREVLAWEDGLLLNAARQPELVAAVRAKYHGVLGVYLHHRGLTLESFQKICAAGCDLLTTQNHHYFAHFQATT